ncbi:MAG TPA: hypothetical protein VM240_02415 [Verrucomicrobiae bacterium]|nr:hypothetical protein [Verrucomicrobiae bacterium]
MRRLMLWWDDNTWLSWTLAAAIFGVGTLATHLQMAPMDSQAAWAKWAAFVTLIVPTLIYGAEYDKSYSSSAISRFGLCFFTLAAVIGVFE